MENTRTIYRLRNYKISITIACISLFIGMFVYSTLNLFEKQIKSYFTTNIVNVLRQNDQQFETNKTVELSNKMMQLIEKSAHLTIVFSIELFIIIFVLVRLSRTTLGYARIAPILLGFGILILSSYYLFLGINIQNITNIHNLEVKHSIIKIIGITLIFIGNIMFIWQVFSQIVLERIKSS